ncbi:N-6 DNA methylase [Microcoleus vaginatus DQ-U2]|uniref:N-6 DNA methylase n=1 Tax=Microcoleus vaginatus TaxID=119532 RepID=UPI0016831208|nr:N-6 DNA methylase [Microcoleus sp. FACHB-DQ6]
MALSKNSFDIPLNENGKIVDFLSSIELEPKPEEYVRQLYLRTLHYEYHYPKSVLAREVPIYYGRSEVKDKEGNPVRADIVVYNNAKACKERNQGQIEIIVECKAPSETDGSNQLVSYIFNTSSNGAAWFNGDNIKYFRRLSTPSNILIDWTGLPRIGEVWDSLGRRNKSDLLRPKDIKGLLRRCHNKLHGRGIDGDEDDLTMDMIRLILAKAIDEEKPENMPDFYCTPEEYGSDDGRKSVALRVQSLFQEAVRTNPLVFSETERITVGDRAICDVVNELQSFRLLSNLHDSDDWDIMGSAYEQYTASYLKRQQGQFFTNRLVIDLMVAILNPDHRDIILDPAGGSGGFLTGAMRFIRKNILTGTGTKISKERMLDKHRTNLFMIDQSKRLVKIAKTAMILNGDGHTGMTQGDSLGLFTKLDDHVIARAGEGKPTIILTNPPFGGVGEGRITDKKILDNYSCGMKWTEREGKFEFTSQLIDDGVPPEMLFFERCLKWIAPGGKIGIVMPKSFLDTTTYYPARKQLFDGYKLLAVVNCHKNTFQPHTGVRTCLVFIYRPKKGENLDTNYSIFMGVSKKVGQDSEGIPIFKRDDKNTETDVIDHDLNEILSDYRDFENNALKESEYRFSVERVNLSETLCINPQFYLPNLNKTIKQIEEIDGIDGWSVSTLGQVSKDILIFKGPRIKTENLVVDDDSKGTELYYPPMSVLQEKSESAKPIDTSRASKKQLQAIKALRVNHGDILVTRSGTIGRVAYATKKLIGVIVSDDMIRVRIPDEHLRLYVYAYLQSFAGYDQMIRNEYGSVQQHLEAKHISSILIPIPNDWKSVENIIIAARSMVRAKEDIESSLKTMSEEMAGLLRKNIAQQGGADNITVSQDLP